MKSAYYIWIWFARDIIALGYQALKENAAMPQAIPAEGSQIARESAEIKRLREANKALLLACKVLVAQLEDSLAGVHDESGRVFIPGKTDLELRPDGSFLLSHSIPP